MSAFLSTWHCLKAQLSWPAIGQPRRTSARTRRERGVSMKREELRVQLGELVREKVSVKVGG